MLCFFNYKYSDFIATSYIFCYHSFLLWISFQYICSYYSNSLLFVTLNRWLLYFLICFNFSVTTIQASKTLRTASHLKPQNSICSVIPLPTASVKPGFQSTGIKLATLTIPVNKPTKMAITPHKKIVVETSPASVPTGVSVTAALSSPASSSASVSVSSATVPPALTAIVRTPTAHPIVSQTVPVVSAVKQILTPADSQIVSGSPLAVNPLLGQSLTRTQILNTSMLSSPSVSTSTTTSSNQISSMHPVVSLTPVSQLVSPAVHVPSGLPQTAQLNMFPIIQSQLFPTNQVVGQSVTAKPLVMVTVPTTTTVQVSVAMTPTTTWEGMFWHDTYTWFDISFSEINPCSNVLACNFLPICTCIIFHKHVHMQMCRVYVYMCTTVWMCVWCHLVLFWWNHVCCCLCMLLLCADRPFSILNAQLCLTLACSCETTDILFM